MKIYWLLIILFFSLQLACKSRTPGNAAYGAKRRPSEVRARSDKKIRNSQQKVFYRDTQRTTKMSKRSSDFHKSKYKFKRVRNKEKKAK